MIAIDPGVRGCGVAIFGADGSLMRAHYVKGDAFAVALELETELVPGERVVIELPQTYGGRASRGDANDLIKLAQTVGILTGKLHEFGADPETVLPRQWKGTVEKHAMVRRIISKLDAEEQKAVELPAKSLQHNVWDAVGIGLKFSRRM